MFVMSGNCATEWSLCMTFVEEVYLIRREVGANMMAYRLEMIVISSVLPKVVCCYKYEVRY